MQHILKLSNQEVRSTNLFWNLTSDLDKDRANHCILLFYAKSYKSLSTECAINYQLKWAILLYDIIFEGKKLSKLRSCNRQ